jgi:inner membrane protein
MFVAHLPAGYLITSHLEPSASRRLLALGLAASVLPDVDLVRFYLVDHGRVPHHAYFTHVPLFWAVLAVPWFIVAFGQRSRDALIGGVVFFANVFGHLALDTVAGGIRWLAPFSDRSFALVTVPARYGWWVTSFALHWTILVELAIVAAAAWAFLGRRGEPQGAAACRAPHPVAAPRRPGSSVC